MNRKRLEEFHKNNILRAADRLFRERGYETTTMDRIAKLANYSKTTVYAYFPGKEAVFFTLVLQHVVEIDTGFARVLDGGGSFKRMFRDMCLLLVKMDEESPVYFEGMIGHINMRLDDEDTPGVFHDIFRMSERINDKLYLLVDQGIKEGEIDSQIDKVKTVLYLWGSITGIIRMGNLKADYLLLKNIIKEDLIDFSFEAVLAGIRKA
jgi:AcrR family transcriptional regulator